MEGIRLGLLIFSEPNNSGPLKATQAKGSGFTYSEVPHGNASELHKSVPVFLLSSGNCRHQKKEKQLTMLTSSGGILNPRGPAAMGGWMP